MRCWLSKILSSEELRLLTAEIEGTLLTALHCMRPPVKLQIIREAVPDQTEYVCQTIGAVFSSVLEKGTRDELCRLKALQLLLDRSTKWGDRRRPKETSATRRYGKIITPHPITRGVAIQQKGAFP